MEQETDQATIQPQKSISRAISSSSVSSTDYIFSKLVPWMYTEKNRLLLGQQGRKALIFSFFQVLIIVPLQITTIVLILSYVVPKFSDGPEYKRAGFIPLYAFISILAQIFQFHLSYQSAKFKNTVQVVFIAIFNLIQLLFSGLQVYEWRFYKNSLDKTFERLQILYLVISVSGFSLVFSCISSWNAFVVYKEFGWSLFERNGASLEKKKMLSLFHTWSVLLEFCWFFNLSVPLQIIWGLIIDIIDGTNVPLLYSNSLLWWSLSALICLFDFLLYFFGRVAIAQGRKMLSIFVFSLLFLNSLLIIIGACLIDSTMFLFVYNYFLFFVVVSIGLNGIAAFYGILCYLEIKNGLVLLGK